MDEIPLFGGDVSNAVVRVGDTVRRNPAPGASAIHAYAACSTSPTGGSPGHGI